MRSPVVVDDVRGERPREDGGEEKADADVPRNRTESAADRFMAGSIQLTVFNKLHLVGITIIYWLSCPG
jgi:hypothetical protein